MNKTFLQKLAHVVLHIVLLPFWCIVLLAVPVIGPMILFDLYTEYPRRGWGLKIFGQHRRWNRKIEESKRNGTF